MYIIAGLGNPGSKYENTRHNMGFKAIDAMASEFGIDVNRAKFKGLIGEGRIGSEKVILLKPQTYMNLSGEAVKLAGGFYKIPPERILVIYDDVSLPVGKLRVRPKGSAGGHNGIKNIIAHLGTDVFPRIKVGVGAPDRPERDMVSWVIGNPTPEEQKLLDQALDRALDAAACVIERGVGEAMNRFNG